MKFSALLLAITLASPLSAQSVFVTIDSTAYPAKAITGAATGTVVGELYFGGLGTDFDDSKWAGKVVLLDRGAISFFNKVDKAKNAGAVAVVVANNVTGVANDGTLAPGTASIPAVSVSQAHGAALKLKVGQKVRVGTAAPVPPVFTLPDPTGHAAGEYLMWDGTKYVLTKPPEFPAGVVVKTEAGKGEGVTFLVRANGTTPLTYQWSKDGKPLPNETDAAIIIPNASAADDGIYVCEVTNALGSTSSSAYRLVVK